MFIYLFTFLLSILFFNFAKKTKSKKVCILLELLGLSLLSLLAGFRSDVIGTDVKVYVAPIFNLFARGNTIHTVTNIYNIEIGYILFTKFFAMFGFGFKAYLFFIEFFILFFSFYGLKKIFKNNYIASFLIFLLLFYNRSLNIVRQSMAISLIIYSLPYLVDKKYLKCIICIIVAYFFHKTAIFFVFAILMQKYGSENKRSNLLFLIMIVLISVFALYGFEYIIQFLVSTGLLTSKYIFYLSNFVNSLYSVSFIDLSLVSGLILLYLFFKNAFDKKNSFCNLFYYFLCFDLLCLLISGKYIATFRLGYYYEIPALIFFLNYLNSVFSHSKRNVIGLVVAFVFWYCMYVIGKDGSTVPYIMSLPR